MENSTECTNTEIVRTERKIPVFVNIFSYLFPLSLLDITVYSPPLLWTFGKRGLQQKNGVTHGKENVPRLAFQKT